MATLSTHVLDTATGSPASGITVVLLTRAGQQLGVGRTDGDGRITSFGPDGLPPGDYQLRFDTGSYGSAFFPEVVVVFTIADDRHHHVPLLLSPYGYSTYRGS